MTPSPDGRAGDEREASAAFDALAARLDPPLAVLTTIADGERAGCVVGFHSQCGIDPPRYAVWLSKANYTYRIGVFAELFAVHLLDRANRGIGELFATATGDEVDKFARCRWTAGPDGLPLLDDVADRIVGRRCALVDAGADHVCLVLAPLDVTDRPDGPGAESWLRAGDLAGRSPGHEAEERHPPD